LIGRVNKYIRKEGVWLEGLIQTIQLTESHEAGEIINGSWFIVNCDFGELNGRYKAGQYVKVINLAAIDVFESDMDLTSCQEVSEIRKSKYYYFIKGEERSIDTRLYCHWEPNSYVREVIRVCRTCSQHEECCRQSSLEQPCVRYIKGE